MRRRELIGGLVFALHTDLPLLADAAGACADVDYLAECSYSPLYVWVAGLIGAP